ncbi:MAG: D-alanyl-D-alanine carboxypeptidase family protein [Rhabdochlamydiaceae bacterium]
MRFLFFAYLFFLSFGLDASKLKVDLSVSQAILINAETGAILFEKNSRQFAYPASITKIVTAWYALEKKGDCLDDLIKAKATSLRVVSSKDKECQKYPPYQLEFGGSHIGIKPGEVLPLRVLLYGLMLSSGNDAANVIAEYVSGDIETFMKEVNQFLKEKGIQNTTFYNPHGLHHKEHKTTAYDMAMIARLAMQNPMFADIVKTVQYERPETNKQPATIFVQSNKLLKSGINFYPKAIGIKTGHTSMAGYTLVAAAQFQDRKLIAVLLNAQQMNERYRDCIALFEAAFSQSKTKRILFNKLYDRFSTSIKGAKSLLEGSLNEDLDITYYPAEEPDFEAVLKWNKLSLPIKKGELVGHIHIVTKDGRLIKKSSLHAFQDVDMTFSYEMAKRIRDFFYLNFDFLGTIYFVLFNLFFYLYFLFICKKKDGRA